MPSLRRTVSSPIVRSSPYPTNTPNAALRAHGHGHRRSSGSDVVRRVVLADITWWTVQDGQRDLEAEQELEDASNDQEASPIRTNEELLAGVGFSSPSELDGTESQFIPAWSSILSSMPEEIPLHHFSAVPRTPPRRGHSLESSTSSLESTPEAPAEGPVEGIRLGIEYLDIISEGLPLSRVSKNTRNENSRSLDVSHRSLMDLFSAPSSTDYADYVVSPLSSHSPQFCN